LAKIVFLSTKKKKHIVKRKIIKTAKNSKNTKIKVRRAKDAK
jgi:hypothetical protein